MIDGKILEAMQKATIAAIAASSKPNFPVKYLGRVFVVPNDKTYIETVFIPNNITNEFWGNEKTYRGIFRLILHSQINDEGFYPSMNFLAEIAEHFAKGSQFAAGAVPVRVYEQPTLESAAESPPEMLFVLSVWYTSFKS